MKSSKKFMMRVLTAALALSMVAGTGICAAAVDEEPIDDEPVVIAPVDDETPDYQTKLEALKTMLSEAAQSAYAKLSQTTLARLAKVVQKVKAADQIMADAAYRDAELKTNFANQLVQISEDAEKLIASADYDEEFEAQIMAAVQEKIDQLSAEVEAQIAENMETAEAESNALLEEANAELEEIKAEIQEKKTKAAEALQAKVDAIQQQIDAVKAQAEAAVQQAKEAIDQAAVTKLVKAQIKTKIAEKIMSDTEKLDSEMKFYIAQQYTELHEAADALIAAAGDNEELAAQIKEQTDAFISQFVDEKVAEIDQMWADAEEEVAALLADAEALKAEGQAQVSEEVEAFRVMLIQKTAEVQAEIDAVKEEITAKIIEYKAIAQKILSDIEQYIIGKTTKTTELEEGDFTYLVYTNCLTDSVTATLINYAGEETEITVPAYTEEGIPVTRVIFVSELPAVTTLNLPATISEVDGLSTMMLASLETINVDEENAFFQSIDGVVFDKDGCCVYAVPQAAEFNAPEGVTAIMDYAYFNYQMEEITLPSTLEYIADGAFAGCANLTKLEIPASVTAIGKNVFEGVAEDFTIYCYTDSCAQEYAEENGINYVLLDAEEEDFYIDVSIVYDDENAYETGVMTLGTSVHLIAEGVGGAGDYIYACYYKKADSDTWRARQGFKTASTNNEISLTPTEAGVYDVCVKVKDAEGTIKKIDFQIEVAGKAEEEEAVTRISKDVVAVGEQLTAYAVADEGMENCTYAFYYKESDAEKWNCRQKFSETDQTTLTFKEAGEYDICIKVKDENNQISKKYFTLTVNEAVAVVG